MRSLSFLCLCACGILFCQVAPAQSTISDEPLELTFGKAFWGVLLPSYNVGITDDGGAAFSDDGDTLGVLWELKAVRRFLGTRTSLETKTFYGLALANASQVPIGVDVPSPIDGVGNSFAEGATHLDSGVHHYGFDIALRDTWRTRLGGLSAGCGFSYMAFDQSYKVQYDGDRLFKEELNTDFIGAKTFVGWDGLFLGRRSSADLVLGFFDMETDYKFSGGEIAGSLLDDRSGSATTFEASVTTWERLGRFDTGLTLSAMYISDMPTIQRNLDGPISLGTDEAVTIRVMIEILL